MFKRMRDRYRRYRLPLLLLALAFSTFFVGNSCSCDDDDVPDWFFISGCLDREVYEGVEYTCPLKLVVNKPGVTISDMNWSIVTTPSADIIKPDGYRIVPTTGQEVTLKLTPQSPFGSGFGPKTSLLLNVLSTQIEVRVDFQSSSDPNGSWAIRTNIDLVAIPLLIVKESVSGYKRLDLGQGNPLVGRRGTILCEIDEGTSTIDGILRVSVYPLESGKPPFQFFATVAPSNKKYATVTRVEALDSRTANIHLKLSLAGNTATSIQFPLFIRAVGADGRVVTDIVDVVLL